MLPIHWQSYEINGLHNCDESRLANWNTAAELKSDQTEAIVALTGGHVDGHVGGLVRWWSGLSSEFHSNVGMCWSEET